MMINWLFPEWFQGWVKGIFRLRPASSGIVSLLRLKNLNLHSHFGRNWRLYILVKPFYPKSSVSRHAVSTNRNVKRTIIFEPDPDLQRLWAWDTEDLGALEVFHFIFISFHFISFHFITCRGWRCRCLYEDVCTALRWWHCYYGKRICIIYQSVVICGICLLIRTK